MSSKINFSVEQLRAIESKEKNLLVSASAGSGKTKVLIERIVRLIKQEHVELSKMLVVTFTKLASLEMKNRLKKELEKECQKNPDLINQLDEINIANISTLHQFCHNTIKEFFYVLQLEPNFNLLDEVNSSYYKTKAVENVFKDYSNKHDKDFESLYEIFYDSRDEKKFKSSVLNVYNFLQSKKEDFYSSSVESCYNTDFSNNPAIKYMHKALNNVIDHYLNLIKPLLIPAQQTGSQRLSDIVNQAIERLEFIKSSDFTSLGNNIANTSFTKMFSNPSLEESEIAEKIKKIRQKFQEEIKKLAPCYYIKSSDDLEKDFEINKKYLSKFYEVVCAFDREYKRLKQDKNSMDFNDLEHYTLKILESQNVQKELQSRFEYIFIDEYQDTNEVQEKIISMLTTNFTNIFMVGDVKQSIYAFRECNPQIFINKQKALLNNSAGEVVRLNANYRSDRDILNFNNLIFNNVMREDTCEIDYKNTSKFVFGESFKRSESNLLPVNICLINNTKEAEDKKIEPVYSLQNDELTLGDGEIIEKEALLVADKIGQLVDAKQGAEIYDNDLEVFRQIDYKDIAILTRTKEAIKKISKILMQNGIPVNAEYKVDLYDSYEVKLLIAMLKLLQNSNDDISLAGVLLSPIVNFSDSDLVKIKQSCNGSQFCECVDNYMTSNNDDISRKLQDFFASLDKYRHLLQMETISHVVREIIVDYKLLEKFFKYDNYLEIKENIQFFVNSIASVDDNNLTAFLSYIENYTDEKKDLLSIKNSVNSVYIGTYHSSKGLEYPAVFVVGLEKEFSNQSAKNKLIKDSEFGMGLSTYDVISKFERSSLIRNIMKHHVLAKEKQEEMRLLYVALTRAKCYLFVIAGCDYKEIKQLNDEYSISHAKNHLEYIIGSLGEDTINKIIEHDGNLIVHYDNLDINIELLEKDEIKIKEFDSKSVRANENVSYLLDYFNKKFETNDYAFKNTVTALMQSENEQTENYNIKNLKINLSKEDEQDFLLIGNNYHKVMQFLNFKSEDSATKQIDALLENQALSSKDLECVDLKKVELAYESIKKIIDSEDEFLTEKQFMFYPKLCDVLSTKLENRVLVQGVVDLLIVKPTEIVVVDYKTSRISSAKGFVDKYGLQLDLYAKAIESFYKKPVTKKIIYSFYLDELIII